LRAIAALLFSVGTIAAQATDSAASSDPQRWNLHFQTTGVMQGHGPFDSPYDGPLSLRSKWEAEPSLTATIYFGLRLWSGAAAYFDGELAGGKGLSGASGLAGVTNGEITRVGSPTPKPYVARAYLQQTIGLGAGNPDRVEDDENQLAGEQPPRRYTFNGGKFSAEDFFDNNTYSHDPRTQFMNWTLMYNGAWDYPADVRGYTWGMVHEVTFDAWSVRGGGFLEPRVANGPKLDLRLANDHGEALEIEHRHSFGGRAGSVRALVFGNHADMGTYREALKLAPEQPDVIATRRLGTVKYGFGLNMDQALTTNVGVFARLGWNDGKTESWAFTEVDRTASGGISVKGEAWGRPRDTAAAAVVCNGISGDHASYLAAGGVGFLLGDGRLNYGVEAIFESYYAWNVTRAATLSFDFQHVNNPGYNRDRGPVAIYALRLHIER
jgi:high affinity Mn2+ porin